MDIKKYMIDNAVADLIKREPNLDSDSLTVAAHPQTLSVYSIHDQFKHILTPSALDVLSNKVNQLIAQTNEFADNFSAAVGGLAHILDKLDIKNAMELYDSDKVNVVRKVHRVKFLATRTTTDKLAVAAARLYNYINILDAHDAIVGCLCPLSVLPMAVVDNKPPELIVICYVAIRDTRQEFFDKYFDDVSCEEGGMPKSI